VVTLTVGGAEPQGVKELDDNFIAMPLTLAQQLVYGPRRAQSDRNRGPTAAQRGHAESAGPLDTLIRDNNLGLEVRDFGELTPFYGQAVKLFSAIFLFIRS